MGRFLEQLKVYLKIIRLNHKSTIVAFLGLGFSLALISEGLIFAFSFQYSAFSEYMGEPPTDQFTVSVISFELENALETQSALTREKLRQRKDGDPGSNETDIPPAPDRSRCEQTKGLKQSRRLDRSRTVSSW